MKLTLTDLEKAIELGYVFNIVNQADGSQVILGSTNTNPMPTSSKDIQEVNNITTEFLIWAANYKEYEDKPEQFYKDFEERMNFVVVGLGGLLNPNFKEEDNE